MDVNGDGIADIVDSGISDQTQAGMFAWLGHPDGSFDQTPQRYISNTESNGRLVPGDWNRDGMMDFAQSIGGNSQVEFYFNATDRAPCATSQINPTVTVCQPVDNTYSPSPVRVQADAYDQIPVTALQEYVDNKLVYSEEMSSFDITLPESLGPHFLVTKAWDTKGVNFRSDRNITVYSGTPGAVCPAAPDSASICLPAGTTSSSPVRILANGYAPTAVPTAAQLYIDGKLVISDQGYCYSNGNCGGGTSYLDTTQNLSSGTHDLVFKLWDASGNVYTAERNVTVN